MYIVVVQVYIWLSCRFHIKELFRLVILQTFQNHLKVQFTTHDGIGEHLFLFCSPPMLVYQVLFAMVTKKIICKFTTVGAGVIAFNFSSSVFTSSLIKHYQ